VDPRLSTGAALGRALPPGGDLLFCGRLQPVKGADLLVEAYERAVRRGVRRRLRIIGDGPDRTEVEKRVAAHGLSGRIVFLGALEHDRVLEEMSRAAIVVLTSRSEGCPIVVLEALALGRPVIAPRVGGIPDLIGDGRSGRLYRAGNVDELVEALLDLDDDEVASGLAAVPETLLERHGIGPVAAAYLGVYRATAGGSAHD
jgi:glycosyltransferase involved in cell wall biosynthesis